MDFCFYFFMVARGKKGTNYRRSIYSGLGSVDIFNGLCGMSSWLGGGFIFAMALPLSTSLLRVEALSSEMVGIIWHRVVGSVRPR